MEGSLEQQTREVLTAAMAQPFCLQQTAKDSYSHRQFRMPDFREWKCKLDFLLEAVRVARQRQSRRLYQKRNGRRTGYKIAKGSKVFEAFMSPGSVTEILHFFIAEYSKSMKVHEGGGFSDRARKYRSVGNIRLTWRWQMIRSGEIKDAKTIMLLQYVKLQNIM
jgi:hypothetical protein